MLHYQRVSDPKIRIRYLRPSVFIASLVFYLLFLSASRPVLAFNPPALQIFYLTLPEDTMLQYFRDNFAGGNPVSPVRSVTSIAIGTNGTIVYYDQWENGSYETDMANPGSNIYNAVSNPAGTQIWGDGVIANGCPPSINNTPNPCALPEHDRLQKGDVITLDNQVIVQGSPGSYSRNPAQIFFDGRDKIGVTLPVAVNRSMWPTGVGSLVADAQSVLPTERWGTQYVSPVGENIASTGQSYEDVRWLIMAGPGGANITVDVDGPGPTAPFNQTLAQGEVRMVDGIQTGATLNSNNPVQVTLLTADMGSTYENRFYNLIPRADWVNDYYTPVGTGTGTQCTNVWVYNPNASPITVNYTFGNGGTGTINVAANTAVGSPNIPDGFGARFYTTGSPAPVFLPVSMTDCTNSTSGDIYDWGNELYPLDQLSPEILVGWAPGCSNEHPAGEYGVCLSTTGLGATTNTKSRNVVWVTPLANTTLYVDLDGSGISCPGGTGAEQVIPANTLQSVRISNDPSNVRDMFSTVAYNNNGPGNFNANWASNWTETGDDNSATGGAIRITSGTLQLRNVNGVNEANRSIQRSVNLAGMGYARLSFHSSRTGLAAGDSAVLEVSPTGSAPWTILQTYSGAATTTVVEIFDISSYATANTTIRFRFVNNWVGTGGDGSTTKYWTIDNVNVDFTAGDGINGTYDMTGAYIRTCDDTLIAAAFGQAPSLSFSSDNEAMDLGMGIPPYGSQIRLRKTASAAFVAPGDQVTYTYQVSLIQTFSTSVNDVTVVDDFCAPVLYASGDGNSNNALDPGETWVFTCTTRLFAPTTNTAMAYAFYNTEPIRSTPAQAMVGVTGSIGDRVWLDEDGDGDQDAGEPGIANVRVTLTGTDVNGNPISRETVTDSNGRYLFPNLPPSNASGYTIAVDTSTLPAGLAANPTYDENGVATLHTTSVVLSADQTHLTADFGYNWASTTETNTNTGSGSIGDRVWIDADGDGFQDDNEAGLAGVTVTLYYDPDGDGIFDTPYNVGGYNPVRTTGATGSYIFDDLPPGAYAVGVSTPAGYAQTGDPDQPGVACTVCDGLTTTPILLAPGDVYVNADFGYQPTGPSNSIGNLIFLDANGDGNWDPGEPGIPGVSVALLDGSGNVIATTYTGADGAYTFPGLPDGTYTVWVNDVDNILGYLRQNSTPDNANDGGQPCGTCNNRNTVTVSGDAGNTFQDFGYAPPGHSSGAGLIGDTVWLDTNGDGSYTPGEGLEGVIVNLLNSSGQIIARTVTNKNGQYFFGELPAGSYTVAISTNTLPNLPNAGYGLENFIDPDGGTPHRASLTLGVAEINLSQDFAYRYPSGGANTIGGTIWNDANADGTLGGGEAGRFAGVTIVLRDSAGNVVATTTTDGNGNYSFTGLPDGTYTVDVTDENNVLNGYWHSVGPNPGANNNSQPDPYTVTVSGGQTNTTADFGYYFSPATLGNYVWLDVNNDGIQSAAEPGLPNVRVTLTVAYPNGSSVTLVTVTDANGFYSFGNLLLDEDFAASGSGDPAVTGLPRYTISVNTGQPALAGLTPAPINQGNGANDSDNPAGVVSTVVQGQANDTYDFGFYGLVDAGNLPNSYNTLFQNSGPGHVQGTITLGSAWDADSNGQPGASPADNDGVARTPNQQWQPGNTVTITAVVQGGSGFLVAWFDWDNNGQFDAGESINFGPVSAGSNALSLVVPASYTTGQTLNVRFRLYEAAPLNPLPTGIVMGGEVEDYVWAFTPTAVTLANFSAGQQHPVLLLSATGMLAMLLLSAVALKRRRRTA